MALRSLEIDTNTNPPDRDGGLRLLPTIGSIATVGPEIVEEPSLTIVNEALRTPLPDRPMTAHEFQEHLLTLDIPAERSITQAPPELRPNPGPEMQVYHLVPGNPF